MESDDARSGSGPLRRPGGAPHRREADTGSDGVSGSYPGDRRGREPGGYPFQTGAMASRMAGLKPPYTPGMDVAGLVDATNGAVGVAPGERVMGVVYPVSRGVVPGAASGRVMDRRHRCGRCTWRLRGRAGSGRRPPQCRRRSAGRRRVGSPVGCGCRRSGGGPGFAAAVRDHVVGGVDGLIDAALLGPPAYEAVRAGGRVIAAREDQCEDPGRDVELVLVRVSDVQDVAVGLADLATLAVQGCLTPRAAQVMPFTAVAEAHRRLAAGGLRGRVGAEVRLTSPGMRRQARRATHGRS
ncbi:MAG: hypothetical protein V7646_3316 [Pseudonocardia sp.]